MGRLPVRNQGKEDLQDGNHVLNYTEDTEEEKGLMCVFLEF